MGDSQAEILNFYTERYKRTKPSHPVLLEAARDTRLTTPYLIELATECVRKERVSDDSVANPALLILQQRVNNEVLDSALLLLESEDTAARQLGAKVLREFPGLDSAPYPYSHRVISNLDKLLEIEQDEEVFTWALSAIGWQCHQVGTEVLWRFVDDKRASVRHIVADSLLMAYGADREIPDSVASALLSLAKDTDSDIRWSVFYDLAEFPDLFKAYRDAFKQAAHSAKQDPDRGVREQAGRAYDALA